MRHEKPSASTTASSGSRTAGNKSGPRPRPRSRSARAPPRSCRPGRSSRVPVTVAPVRSSRAASASQPSTRGDGSAAGQRLVPGQDRRVHSPRPTRSASGSASVPTPLLTSAAHGSSTAGAASRPPQADGSARPQDRGAGRDIPGAVTASPDEPSGRVELAGGDPGQPAAGACSDHTRLVARRLEHPSVARPGSAAKPSVNESTQTTTSTRCPGSLPVRTAGAPRTAVGCGAGRRRRPSRAGPRTWCAAAALASPGARSAGPSAAASPGCSATVGGACPGRTDRGPGLVRRNVDAGRTLARARLAGQAQVQHLALRRRGPSIRWPLTSSCNTRARPRVESFSSRVT